MKIVFFGTPGFAAEILEYLLENGVEVIAAITKPDKPKGRSGTPQPTPVKLLAQKHDIPVFQPPIVSSTEFAPVLAEFQADLFVVAAYGEILKQHLLDMPKLSCINVHASLLPEYRGAAPIQRCIMDGKSETGVTIMHMVKKMDAGDIIKSEKVPIGPDTTFGELYTTLSQLGSRLLLEVIHDLEKGVIEKTPQESEKATFAPKVEPEDCAIIWGNSAQSIHDLVRGTNPFPGAWCTVEVRGKPLRMKVTKTQCIPEGDGLPGTILTYGKEGLGVACGSGAIRLLEVRLEGKQTMSAEELMRGYPKEELRFL